MSANLLIIFVLVFTAAVFVLTKLAGGNSQKAKRKLENISREFYDEAQDDSILLKEEKIDAFGEAVIQAPFIGGLYKKLKLSGLKLPFALYLLVFLLSVTFFGYLVGNTLNKMYPIGFAIGFVITLTISNIILGRRIEKREEYYLNNFPDAVDMIVRSVRSGQPLTSALKMIAANSSKPLADDVQRVIDEVAYGRPLTDALKSMAERVGFVDMNFFVVILSVQQETGGNLSEILSNLANIIRKRKQLKLKVKALTAQSKMTTMIFSSIPLLQMSAVYFIQPEYLRPFWTTNTGVYCFLAGLGAIAIAVFLGKKVSKIEV